LLPLLLAAGHAVSGATRSADKAKALGEIGVEPFVVDVFDAAALERTLIKARPEVVIHQLTDLPHEFDETQLAAAYQRNARIRTEARVI
jgi:uncharacterized protein YbjT (DUF2867 family)